MNVDKGEEIVSALVSGHIKGTGRYKFLAKKRIDRKIEWAHYVERDNGMKEKVYRGQLKNEEELGRLLAVMNKTLMQVFGPIARLSEGIPEFRTLSGVKLDRNMVN